MVGASQGSEVVWIIFYEREGQLKKKKKNDHTSTSVPGCIGEAEAMPRPIGVKAAKAKGRSKSKASEEEVKSDVEVQSMWELRQQDFALKDKLNKQKLLDHLLAKTEPLSELEMTFKNKLITEMMSSQIVFYRVCLADISA